MPAAANTCTIRAPRYASKHQARICFTQPGSNTPRRCMVSIKDISASGIGVYYRNYLHPGTRCEAELITLYGSWLTVRGTVARCRYVDSGMHEIGIILTEDIDIGLVCPDANVRQIVVLTEDDILWELASTWLGQSSTHTSRVVTEEDYNAAIAQPVDVVLIDETLSQLTGPELVSQIRQGGFMGHVIGLTKSGNDQLHTGFMRSGCDLVIEKPLTNQAVEQLLQETQVERTVSVLAEDPAMADVLTRCVGMLENLVINVTESIRAKQLQDVMNTAYRIHAVSEGCGFLEISGAVECFIKQSGDCTPERLCAEFGRVARLISVVSA
jgi:CheY-like chemotaxis protein